MSGIEEHPTGVQRIGGVGRRAATLLRVDDLDDLGAVEVNVQAVDTAMLEADGRLTPWRIVDGRLTEAQTIGGREGYVLVDLKAGAREMYVILRADDGASGTLPIRSTRGRFETWLYLIDPSTDG